MKTLDLWMATLGILFVVVALALLVWLGFTLFAPEPCYTFPDGWEVVNPNADDWQCYRATTGEYRDCYGVRVNIECEVE